MDRQTEIVTPRAPVGAKKRTKKLNFLAPTGAQGVKMSSVCVCVCVCVCVWDFMLKRAPKQFQRVLEGLRALRESLKRELKRELKGANSKDKAQERAQKG